MPEPLWKSAAKGLRTFGAAGGRRRRSLVPTGFRAVDAEIGGLARGEVGLLAAQTGVGKSGLMLDAVMQPGPRTGVLSLEDRREVLGVRAAATVAGVDSLAIRRGETVAADRMALRKAVAGKLAELDVWVEYRIGASPDELAEGYEALAAAGCTRIWIDVLHKVRGTSGSRRDDVAMAFARVQRLADATGTCALVVAHLKRLHARRGQRGPVRPTIWDLKESGDLENDARLILLAWRDGDEIWLEVAKSTVGGEGVSASWRRDARGNLREIEED